MNETIITMKAANPTQKPEIWQTSYKFVKAPEIGLEPTTHRLTADCSTIELLRNKGPNIDLYWAQF